LKKIKTEKRSTGKLLLEVADNICEIAHRYDFNYESLKTEFERVREKAFLLETANTELQSRLEEHRRDQSRMVAACPLGIFEEIALLREQLQEANQRAEKAEAHDDETESRALSEEAKMAIIEVWFLAFLGSVIF